MALHSINVNFLCFTIVKMPDFSIFVGNFKNEIFCNLMLSDHNYTIVKWQIVGTSINDCWLFVVFLSGYLTCLLRRHSLRNENNTTLIFRGSQR